MMQELGKTALDSMQFRERSIFSLGKAFGDGEGFNLSKLKCELQGVGLPLFPRLPSHLIHQPVGIDGLRNNRAVSNTQILCNVDRGGEAGKRKGSFKFQSLIHRGKIGF